MESFAEVIGLLLFALVSVILSDKNRKSKRTVQRKLNPPPRHPQHSPADPTAEDIRYWAVNERDEDEHDFANDGIDQQSEIFEGKTPSAPPVRVEASSAPTTNPFSSGATAIGQEMLKQLQAAGLRGDDLGSPQPQLGQVPSSLKLETKLESLKVPELPNLSELGASAADSSAAIKAEARSAERRKEPPARGKNILSRRDLRRAVVVQSMLGQPRAVAPWDFGAQDAQSESSQ